MATYSEPSPQAPLTSCEVAYDPDWFLEEHLFPFRSSSTCTGTPASRHVYRELISTSRSLYSEHISREDGEQDDSAIRSFTSLGNYGGQRNPSVPSFEPAPREYDNGRGRMWQKDRAATALSNHSRHHHRVSVGGSARGFSGTDTDQNFEEDDIEADQLRWVDALNSWIPDKKPSQAFVTFVQTVPVKERLVSPTTEGFSESTIEPCPRFQAHMKLNTELHPLSKRGKSAMYPHRCKSCKEVEQEQVEETLQVQRSHSVADYLSQKRTKVRFCPPSQPSQSSTSPLPPAPPPSVSRTRSAGSTSKSENIPSRVLGLGEDNVPPVVLEVTEEGEKAGESDGSGVTKTPVLTAELLGDIESSSYLNSLSRRNSTTPSQTSDSNSHLSWPSSTQDLYSKHERTKVHVRWKIQNDAALPENVGDNIESNESDEGNNENVKMSKYIETCYGEEAERKKILKRSPVRLPTRPATPPSITPSVDAKDAVALSLMIKHEETQLPKAEPLVKPQRTAVIKKTKKEREKSGEKSGTASSISDSSSRVTTKTQGDWIYNDDDETPIERPKTPNLPSAKESTYLALPPKLPSPKAKEKKSPPKIKPKKQLALPLTEPTAKRSGQSSRDTTYEDELRRQQLAEERRKKQQFHIDRLKMRKYKEIEEELEEEEGETPRFEDFGFLAKYCILNKGALETYKSAFDSVSSNGQKSWLSRDEVAMALKGLNINLSGGEAAYLRRVMELMGYRVSRGADFKLFSVLAALSQKISSLDSWMKNLIGSIDFKLLEMKMFMCKTLWECNVDGDTSRISLDQLCVELRAGGVSEHHEQEVRQKMGHLVSLDLLDFLTYIPLFIMIHESVVENPLCDRREK